MNRYGAKSLELSNQKYCTFLAFIDYKRTENYNFSGTGDGQHPQELYYLCVCEQNIVVQTKYFKKHGKIIQ
jgi:hypothetical protein